MDSTRHQPFRLTSKLPIGHDQYWNLIANPNRGAVLFGDLGGSSVTHFFHDCHSLTSIHQKIRRDYPLEGDCALAFWQEKKPHETRWNCEDLEVHTLNGPQTKREHLCLCKKWLNILLYIKISRPYWQTVIPFIPICGHIEHEQRTSPQFTEGEPNVSFRQGA